MITGSIVTTLILLLCLQAPAASEAGSPPARQEGVALVAVEWIPLHVHTELIGAIEKHLQHNAPAKAVRRINVFADDGKLTEVADELRTHPPAAIIAFGDHVLDVLVTSRVEAPIIAALSHRLHSIPPNVFPLITDPTPEMIWQAVSRFPKKPPRLGVLYTAGYQPNSALADALEREAPHQEVAVVRIEVPGGFCRTDSDYSFLVRAAVEKHNINVLYVPDDPNSSRFGDTIYRTANELRLSSIGGRTTGGKGCHLYFDLDINTTGAHMARLCSSLAKKEEWPKEDLAIPPKVVIDEKTADPVPELEKTHQ